MKKLVLSLLVILVPLLAIGQNSAVEDLFDKYGGKDGFTTVTINKGLLELAAGLDEDDEELQALAGIKTIKILAVEEDGGVSGVNFYNEVMGKLKKAEYEELMTVDSSDGDVIFLVKKDDDVISELILVAGSENDENALIYIAGKIKLKDVAKLSKSMGVDGEIKVPGL